jgi:glycine/D-amino acid oxidase-like deaminating enzyme
MDEDDRSVLIVGAGVVGCRIAHELTGEDGYDVTVLDRGNVAEGATALAAGLIAPSLYFGEYPEIAHHLTDFFEDFDGTRNFSLTERPRYDFVKPDDVSDAKSTAAELSAEGFPVEYVTADEILSSHSEFKLDDYAGAVRYEDTGWVDPFTYATALKETAADQGAAFETGVEITDVLVEGDEVQGVVTPDGTRSADAVVVAAGWRTPEVLPADLPVPVRPYRTQCIVLHPDEPLPERFPIGRLGDEHFYFRPEHNGDILIGGGQHICADPAAASSEADESFKREVAEFVPNLIEGGEAAGFVNGWAGIDAATPDARPIVDRHPNGPDGLVVATGFNGLGIMLSPMVGPLARWLVADSPDDPPLPHSPFSFDRFDDLAADFSLQSTSDL